MTNNFLAEHIMSLQATESDDISCRLSISWPHSLEDHKVSPSMCYLIGFVPDLVDGEVFAVFQASHELIPHLLVLLPHILTEVYFVPANPKH